MPSKGYPLRMLLLCLLQRHWALATVRAGAGNPELPSTCWIPPYELPATEGFIAKVHTRNSVGLGICGEFRRGRSTSWF